MNGSPLKYTVNNGYALINRQWKKGDVIALDLPMPVRKIKAIDSVKVNRNRVALQRGPLVYCVEQPDNGTNFQNFIIPENAVFKAEYDKGMLNGIVKIKGAMPVIKPAVDGKGIKTGTEMITAIPYYSWANRGKSQMQVWLPTKIESIAIKTGGGGN